jgi:hypothetical protein
MKSKKPYRPFCYYLYHRPTGVRYYGVRYGKSAHPDTLWTTYFSSSSLVRDLIKEYGADSFDVSVRRVFDTKEDALLWERRFLKRIDAKSREDWLNQHNGHTDFAYDWTGRKRPELSERLKGKPNPHGWKTRGRKNPAVSEALRENKKGNTNVRGKKWYHIGQKSGRYFPYDVPDGWVEGRINKGAKKKKSKDYSALGGKDCVWMYDTEGSRQRVKKELVDNWKLSGWQVGAPHVSLRNQQRRGLKREQHLVDGLAEQMRGRSVYTDGESERRLRPGDPIPEGWYRGRSEKFRTKASETLQKRKNVIT